MGDDNPAFEGIFEFCSISAGGTIGMFLPQGLVGHKFDLVSVGGCAILVEYAGGLILCHSHTSTLTPHFS